MYNKLKYLSIIQKVKQMGGYKIKKRFQVFVPRMEVYSNYFEKLEIRTKVIEINTEDIYSPEDLPGFNKSTIDGYAVHSKDTLDANKDNPVVLKIVGEVFMGKNTIEK
ncbi:MAG: hypothetical protein H0Z24_07130 [Thermosipho sp. (in: Bacteria)]|nr:hypothetical protein [Thermosipho sp. (in: thermotogales)]